MANPETRMQRRPGRVFEDFTELHYGETFYVEFPAAEIPDSIRDLIPPPGMLCPIGLPAEDAGVVQTTRAGTVRVFVELSDGEFRALRARGVSVDSSTVGWVPPGSWPEERRRRAAISALVKAADMGLW